MLTTAQTIVIIVVLLFFLYYMTRESCIDPDTGIELSKWVSKEDMNNLKEGQKKMTRMIYEFEKLCRKDGDG